MKCIIPEISWHNREPVLSVHIQPISDKFYRLATGGADCHVLIWQLIVNENGAVKIDALCDLTRHQKAVNAVRWSPNGQYLATADDDANIIIWQLKTDNIPLLEGETNDKETWITHKVIRGHKEDIYDLCWSPNGLKLLSGSIDNTAILWDFTKGKSENILTDHKGFVQGVAWDPKSVYFATISTDRICRIYDSSGKQVQSRIQKGFLPVPEDHYLHNKDVKFFHDDTFKSFFRRLDFSPDGTLLAVPSVHVEIEDCKKPTNGTLIFAVDSWTGPVALLPSGKQCSTVARFCPLLFEIHDSGPDPKFSLPFRMVLAVGTDHDIILYDTQQSQPFAYFKDIHYTRITDLTWSNDGLLLIASSTDGYCALITFEPNELGIEYVKQESEAEESILNVSGCEELDKEEITESVKRQKMSFLEKWTVKTPKKNEKTLEINTAASTSKSENKNIDDTTKRKAEDGATPAKKRIKPIPVIEKKNTDITDKQQRDTPVKKATNTPKISPLMKNFLKNPSKGNSEPKVKSAPLVLDDEVEARDAWKCEKNEPKEVQSKVVVLDEYTEDFSLHLEDTNSKFSNDQNKGNVENCNDTTDNTKRETSEEKEKTSELNEVNEKISPNDIKIQNGDCKEENINGTENCVQEKPDTHIELKNDNLKSTGAAQTGDKSNIPKRRIPLITLSSPKQKKK